MYTLDEGKRKGVGGDIGLFLTVGQWPNISPQNTEAAKYQHYETLYYLIMHRN
jgi:hypothetical protein